MSKCEALQQFHTGVFFLFCPEEHVSVAYLLYMALTSPTINKTQWGEWGQAQFFMMLDNWQLNSIVQQYKPDNRVSPQHSFNDLNVYGCCAYWHNPVVPSAAAGPAWAPAATPSALVPAHTWRQTVARESWPSHRTSTCFPGHCSGRTPSQSSLCSLCRWKSHLVPRHPALVGGKVGKKITSWQDSAWKRRSTLEVLFSPAGLCNRTISWFESPRRTIFS